MCMARRRNLPKLACKLDLLHCVGISLRKWLSFSFGNTRSPGIGFASRSRVLLQGWSGCVKESCPLTCAYMCALNSGAHFEVVGKDFIIRSLVKDGPAHRTGQMKVGDRLVSVDGYEAQGIFLLLCAVAFIQKQRRLVRDHVCRPERGCGDWVWNGSSLLRPSPCSNPLCTRLTRGPIHV